MSEPTFDLSLLQKRAQLLRKLRAFFYARGITEVDVPILGDATVTDAFIDSLTSEVAGQTCYLQTSPEFYMKRLLAVGAGSIFSLGKAFRQDELGVRHRPEFTLLEWYRTGFTEKALMGEVIDLLGELTPGTSIQQIAYGALFEQVLGCCPYRASSADLRAVARTRVDFDGELPSKSAWLDLLFSHCIEPAMGTGITLVYDYPLEQCALARLTNNSDGLAVARRFEVFWAGMELANGYWELTDADEQRARFIADQALRRRMGLAVPAYDQRLLAALQAGLPDCAGVAMGVDRLLMCLTNTPDIAQVMPFADR